MPSKHLPRVLCVDGHEDSRVMLSTLLRFFRIETRTAATAAHALWLSQSESFDLNLLDVWLPDLDGFELCRRLRAIDPYTPIVFFSVAAFDADKKRGVEAGADGYVVKPNVTGLIESIANFIGIEIPLTNFSPGPKAVARWPHLQLVRN
jgi:CheY-like chemotaxis protein